MDQTALLRIGFYVCTTIAVVLAAQALFLLVMRPVNRQQNVNRRLKAIGETASGELALKLVKSERGITRDDLRMVGWLRRLLVQSGLRIGIAHLLALQTAIICIVFAICTLLLQLPQYYGLLAAAVIGGLLPLQVIRFIRNQRASKFASQLPDALDIIVRSLRSGHPVPTAFSLVGKEMQDPAGTEFGLTIDEMTYGMDMPQALRNLGERVGVADLSLLVTAVSLQSSSGGNLTEVLSNLSKVLRERFQLRRKVRSLSAEGRMSGYGLFVLPMLIAGVIFVQNPRYYTDVWDEPVFLPILGGLIIWSFIGDLMMYKMINFKY
jgi:tight adherence protein B